jgi:PIN domain nuclease of toxin-antitoxin system
VRLLLDTNAWLWLTSAPSRLSPAAAAALADADTPVHLSSVSTWEMALKISIGRLALPEALASYQSSRMARHRISPLPVSHTHAARVSDLPPHHRDPFDRMLVAQAEIEGLTLVTSDAAMKAYGIPLLLT